VKGGIVRTHGRALVSILALAVSALGQPTPAGAQQGWSGTATLHVLLPGTGLESGEPDVGLDSAGNAIVVWTVGDFAPFFNGSVWAVRYSADGRVSGAQQVSSQSHPWNPQLAVDPAGNAIAVWTDGNHVAGYQIVAARYSAASGSWDAPLSLSGHHDPRNPVDGVSVGIDAAGNAMAVWREYELLPAVGRWVRAARYTATSGTWTTPITLAFSSGGDFWAPALSVGPMGEAFALWIAIPPGSPEYGGTVQSARYDPVAGGWGNPVNLSGAGELCRDPDIGADAHGNAIAAWTYEPLPRSLITRASRYTSATGEWVFGIGIPGGGPRVTVEPQGDAIVVWTDLEGEPVLNASRYRAATDEWRWWELTTIPAAAPDGALDAFGNATVAWYDTGQRAIHAMRNTGPDETWWSHVTLSPPGLTGRPFVAAIADGAVLVAWRAWYPEYAAIQIAAWRPQPVAPTVTAVAASPGAIAVSFGDLPTGEPAFAPANYAYSLDDGTTWIPREPASTASPLVIAGLSDAATYSLRLRAINHAGPGLASPRLGVKSGTGAHTPSGLTATSITGHRVTLAWAAPAVGFVPSGYLLEGGTDPGGLLARIPTGSAATVFTFDAPTGAFYVRVRAAAGLLWSAPSNEILIFVNVPAPPSPPANLLGLVNGSDVVLSWTNTFEGGAPASLRLTVTGAVTATLPLPFGEAFTLAGVPAGTYSVTVRAANASGVSAPSNAVTLTFPSPCSGAPSMPTSFQAWKQGATIFVAWAPPAGGPAVTGYSVLVSGTYSGSVPTTGRSLSGAVGPGTYVLSVAASNPCGTGPATPAETVVIP
jgi:hypothetical protein